MAGSLDTRYTDESLVGVLSDVINLSQCEFLVCTFSSQICRLSFELMQSRYIDATERYISLDDPFYYGGGSSSVFRSWLHVPATFEAELPLEPEDTVQVVSRIEDGHWPMTKGKSERGTGELDHYMLVPEASSWTIFD